jgi:pimeloyl-ACP methyl ester carboxylesterase
MTLAALLLIAAILGGGWLYSPDKNRAELEAQYAAPPSRFMQVAGIRLHVRDSGPLALQPDTPAVILLHGFGSSLHTWDSGPSSWAAGLAGTQRVIRIDLPGAGLTGADPTGDYSDARGVHIILALMDQLGLARASLVGHSMGGRLAWRLAAEHPERVAKLVLVAPDGFASAGFEYGRAPDVPAIARWMQYMLPKAVLRMSLAPAYADPAKISHTTLTRYHDMMLAPQVRSALLARMEQMALQDPLPWLRRVSAPTLLVWGEQDQMIPVANAQNYLQALPNARLVTYPAVGHVPHEEAPEVSLPAVREFLAQLSDVFHQPQTDGREEQQQQSPQRVAD